MITTATYLAAGLFVFCLGYIDGLDKGTVSLLGSFYVGLGIIAIWEGCRRIVKRIDVKRPAYGNTTDGFQAFLLWAGLVPLNKYRYEQSRRYSAEQHTNFLMQELDKALEADMAFMNVPMSFSTSPVYHNPSEVELRLETQSWNVRLPSQLLHLPEYRQRMADGMARALNARLRNFILRRLAEMGYE